MGSGTVVVMAVTTFVLIVVPFASFHRMKPSEEELKACDAKATEGSSISEDTKTKVMALMDKAREEHKGHKGGPGRGGHGGGPPGGGPPGGGPPDGGPPGGGPPGGGPPGGRPHGGGPRGGKRMGSFDEKVDADESITQKDEAKKFIHDFHRCLFMTSFAKKVANCKAAVEANNGQLTVDEIADIMPTFVKFRRENRGNLSDEVLQAKMTEKFGEEKGKAALAVHKAMMECWKEEWKAKTDNGNE